MNKRKTFRVVSEHLNLVLLIKGLTSAEERKLYNTILTKFDTAKTSISLEEYKEFIIQNFLVDGEAFIKSPPESLSDQFTAIDLAYEAIIAVYAPFAAEFICQHLNTDTFFAQAGNKFLKRMREQIEKQVKQETLEVSTMEDIRAIEDYITANLIGQDDAVKALTESLKLLATGLSKQASFLFVGPTGVGKTELARLLGDKYSGNFFKINCAEYAQQHEYAKLIGSPPGYVGHSEKSVLGEKAEKSNRWVFLLDEIEKAHPKLYDFFLSVLDDGTCTDNMGNVLDFTESIFIFTSNQGTNEVKRDSVGFSKDGMTEQVASDVIQESIKRHFSAEFLNRLDETIYFNALTKAQVKQIALIQLADIPITPTDSLLNFVAEGGYSPEYGARHIIRFIKKNVSIKIADAILDRKVPKVEGTLYTPKIVKGEVKLVNLKKFIEAEA